MQMRRMSRGTAVAALWIATALGTVQAGAINPGFSKAFAPATIGPGGVSVLTFTINNTDMTTAADSVAFTDTLPAGVTIASPRRIVNACQGTLSAPAGGGTISFSGGRVGANASCTIQVDVTSSTVGTHMNTTGAITSSFGSAGTATANLTVANDRPGFSKAFSPASISLGGTSRLTFTIDNTANGAAVQNLDFTDVLPTGVTVGSPANASTTCGTATIPATFAPAPGSSTITLDANGLGAFPAIAAGATCTASVDVVANSFGTHVNVSGELLNDFANPSGRANAQLQVVSQPLNLSKSFDNDPTISGETVNVTYRIFNLDRNNSATAISFSDNFSTGVAPALAGLAISGGLPSNPCGAGSSLSGSTTLTLSGGSLAPDSNCSFTVALLVPGGTTANSYVSTSGAVSATVGGAGTTGSTAADTLVVKAVPKLTLTGPATAVAAGGNFDITYRVDNSDTGFAASDVTFSFHHSGLATGITPNGLTASQCGGTVSNVPGVPSTDDFSTRLSGGSIAAASFCSFVVNYSVPLSAPIGTTTITSTDVTATINGASVSGPGKPLSLQIASAPRLVHELAGGSALPGATATLRYTLSLPEESPGNATAVSFTHDLNAVEAGLTAATLPASGFCGAGSTIAGTTNLSISGASVAAGDSCSFDVTVQIPANPVSGTRTSTTSTVSATVAGLATQSNASTTTFLIAALSTVQSFTNDPVFPGDTVNLQFTLTNNSPTDTISNIFFTEALSSVISGATATVLPAAGFCGAGSTASGTTTLTIAGANLAAGANCVFSVTVQVPANAAANSYTFVTGNVSATQGGTGFVGTPFSDTLVVSEPLQFSKSFTNDPVAPGGTVNLRYTIQNLNTTQALSAVGFSDNYNAALTGLQASGAPANTCGGTFSGTTTGTLAGGALAANSSCTIDVTLNVPAGSGGNFNSTSSVLNATVGAQARTAAAASDTLTVFPMSLSAAFTDSIAVPGGTATLQLTLSNVSGAAKSGLNMQVNLGAALAGMTASSLPSAGFCGAGSTASGTGVINLVNMNLANGASCVVSIPLQLPAGAAAAGYTLNTSAILESGIAQSSTGSATFTVVSPTFAKAFSPAATAVGGSSTLTFTINNGAAAVGLSGISFSDNLPAGLVVAPTPNASTTCAGGTLTAVAGSGSISYSSGALAAGASCTVQADVQASTAGSKLNTASVLSVAQGALSTAPTATLTVSPLPTFAKAFAAAAIYPGAATTLTFTINNSAGTVAMPALAFTDNLPAGMQVAATPNASTTCTGGTLTAAAAATALSYSGGTVAAGATCTVAVDVTVAGSGSYNNTSSVLSTGFGTVPAATASVTAVAAPAFSKAFAPSAIVRNGVSTLTFTINNAGSTLAATGLNFTDNLPAGVVVATPSNASTTCTGGTLTAVAASSTISYTGGSVGAGLSCTVQADVTAASNGSFVNTSGALTSAAGNSGTASATLVVADAVLTLTKSITPLTPRAGDTLTVNYTVQNGSTTLPISNIGFSDNFASLITGAAAAGLPQNNVCGAGSTLSGTGTVTLAGASLAAGAQCSFSVQIVLPGNAPNGNYVSTSSALTGTVAGGTAGGGAASANFDVVTTPLFSKVFAQTTIAAGTSTTLTYSINNAANSVAVTGLAFTDALPAGLLIASPANASTTCAGGTVTAAAGGTSVALSTGSVAASATCLVSVNVTAPAAGSFVSPVVALASSLGSANSNAATLNAATAGLTLSKTISPAVILPGGEFQLTYQLSNTSSGLTIDQIAFTDDVLNVVPGSTVIAGPAAPPCGIGSTFGTGTPFALTGGTLAAGSTCQFVVRLRMPATATLGARSSTSSAVSSNVAGASLSWPAASATLNVGFVTFTKTMPDQAAVGSLIDLRFTIVNPDALNAITALSFSDDLDAFLPGARAEGLPQNGVCGAGSTLTGTAVVQFSNGVLAPGTSCSFVVRVRIPIGASVGTFQNRTSSLLGAVGGSAINVGAAGVAGAPISLGGAAPTQIPSLSWLGLLAMIGLLLGTAGLWLQRRS